ncbi:MAG: response regulator [Patescibacteria group bacterium]|nr:response regulator [Patescibacteria group bacterium]
MEGRRKKVLIVDDEEPLAKALRYKFEKSGFDATAVFNGDDGLALLQKESFDAIVLDLMMPGKDGFTVLRELKKAGSSVPIVVASNLGQEKDIREAKALGAVDYIVKSDTPIFEVIGKVHALVQDKKKTP